MFYKDWRPQDMLSVVQDSETSATRRQGLAARTNINNLPFHLDPLNINLRALSGVCLVVWKVTIIMPFTVLSIVFCQSIYTIKKLK